MVQLSKVKQFEVESFIHKIRVVFLLRPALLCLCDWILKLLCTSSQCKLVLLGCWDAGMLGYWVTGKLGDWETRA